MEHPQTLRPRNLKSVAMTKVVTGYPPKLVLLLVFRYAVFRFVLVEKTKSAKNIWEPVFENVIILGFLMAEHFIKTTKNIHIFLNMSHFYFILSKSHVYIHFNIS